MEKIPHSFSSTILVCFVLFVGTSEIGSSSQVSIGTKLISLEEARRRVVPHQKLSQSLSLGNSKNLFLVDSGFELIEINIRLNFYFHTSLWCLKRFYEGLKGLHFEAPQRSVEIKI